jgi:hypothetical protein
VSHCLEIQVGVYDNDGNDDNNADDCNNNNINNTDNGDNIINDNVLMMRMIAKHTGGVHHHRCYGVGVPNKQKKMKKK